MSGYFSLRLQLDEGIEPEDVDWVRVGSVHAYALTPEPGGFLTVTVQGHATPGPVPVTVGVGEKTHEMSESFVYEAPVSNTHWTLFSIGASLTQGIQRGVPTEWSLTHGPAALVARQMGVYFPLPILVDGAFEEMTPDLMGPPPFCQPPPLDAFQIEQASTLIPMAFSEETQRFEYALTRVDPLLDTHNLAVGGSRVGDTLDGPPEDELAMNFLGHMVYEPQGTLGDPVTESQMERLESQAPDVLISFDLLGNDFILGVINDADFSVEDMTPIDTFLANIDRAVDRLAQTEAEVFLANLPLPTALPFFRAKRARLASEGLTENAALFFETIEAGTVAANERVAARADLYSNVHVIDVYARVNQWLGDGVQLGDQTLYIEPYGGLVGLDGLHFTDTAYALLANMFLERMATVLEADFPLVDLSTVWATDRERRDQLSAEGFDASACESF